ncbi:MAG TPA: MltA domain-containing protein [Stellaceae bacterium]|nr:MltA domain-containing protein [Stellaceae bacterium]
MGWRAATTALLLVLAACAPRPPAPPRLTLEPASFSELAGWSDDATAAALPSFRKSCALLAKLAPDAKVGPNGIAGTARDWQGVCAAAMALGDASDADARQFFAANFVPLRVGNNGQSQGLFTGYFEPELSGSRTRGGKYTVPLLKRPPDLVSVDLGLFRPDWTGERIAGRVVDGALRPYNTRAEIERGALDRMNLPLLWVDDPVDAFVLSIQGSGRVRLPDGSLVQLGYDGQNGRRYVPIGRVLVERGELQKDNVSLQSIRAWLAAHPDGAQALMDENPAYVFFRELASDGPVGAEGAVLTAGRSLAVDPKFLPLGAPMWLDASQNGTAIRRLVVAQDTGGAIRGPVRGDLFWGFGAAAEQAAGRMRADGAYYLLLPRALAPGAARTALSGRATLIYKPAGCSRKTAQRSAEAGWMFRRTLLGGLAGSLAIGLGVMSAVPAPAQVVYPYPYAAPYPYYYPPAYYPPAVVVAPTVTPVAPKPQSWYYCDNPKGYYPSVQNCTTAWREVPAQAR